MSEIDTSYLKRYED